jgi:hypothetical protein
MAKVVVLKQEPPDALEERRVELMGEAAKLNKVAEARAKVEQQLAALDGDQAIIDAAERTAWHEWAETAEGPPPSPMTAQREAIAQRRVLLAGDLRSAMNGETAIAPRLQTLHAELTEVMVALYQRRVDALLREAEELNEAVHEKAKAFVAICQQSDGLRDAVVEALARLVAGNDDRREPILRAAFSRIEGFKGPKMAGDPEARSRHAADYHRRLL